MSQAPNQALHLTAFSLRSKASGELGRSFQRMSIVVSRQTYLLISELAGCVMASSNREKFHVKS